MPNLTPFQQFIRQSLLYPLASPFLPPITKVQADYSYAAGKLIGTLAVGSPPSVPKTGAVVSYDGNNLDDGGTQLGNPVSPRFVDNGDNTISDKATGLMWIKRPELIIPGGLNAGDIAVERGFIVKGTLYNAGDIVLQNIYPNVYVCLTSHTTLDPVDYADAFAYGWGDLVYDNPTNGGDGTWYQNQDGLESNGATIAEAISNGGTWTQIAITSADMADQDLNLVSGSWQQSSYAQGVGDGSILPNSVSWGAIDDGGGGLGAIEQCHLISKNGHTDWRLPNIKEMISILDYGGILPAIETDFFPTVQSFEYWTSTIDSYNNINAWIIQMNGGSLSSLLRTEYHFYLPCRSY